MICVVVLTYLVSLVLGIIINMHIEALYSKVGIYHMMSEFFGMSKVHAIYWVVITNIEIEMSFECSKRNYISLLFWHFVERSLTAHKKRKEKRLMIMKFLLLCEEKCGRPPMALFVHSTKLKYGRKVQIVFVFCKQGQKTIYGVMWGLHFYNILILNFVCNSWNVFNMLY